MSVTSSASSPTSAASTRRERLLASAAAALLSACGAEPVQAPSAITFPPEATIGAAYGARLVSDPEGEFKVDPHGLVEQSERAIRIGAEVWGVDTSVLDGWTVAFNGGWFVCRAASGPQWTWGCCYPDARTIYAAGDAEARDCPAGVLIHEIGHALIGDPGHLDRRFAEADARAHEPCRP